MKDSTCKEQISDSERIKLDQTYKIWYILNVVCDSQMMVSTYSSVDRAVVSGTMWRGFESL